MIDVGPLWVIRLERRVRQCGFDPLRVVRLERLSRHLGFDPLRVVPFRVRRQRWRYFLPALGPVVVWGLVLHSMDRLLHALDAAEIVPPEVLVVVERQMAELAPVERYRCNLASISA